MMQQQLPLEGMNDGTGMVLELRGRKCKKGGCICFLRTKDEGMLWSRPRNERYNELVLIRHARKCVRSAHQGVYVTS
jgi:hypothetical protein